MERIKMGFDIKDFSCMIFAASINCVICGQPIANLDENGELQNGADYCTECDRNYYHHLSQAAAFGLPFPDIIGMDGNPESEEDEE